jgi:CheY-like chemotaxis protein
MSETQVLTAARTPTVYFIDDSATMREVIKIAFRKENINVITCADAASALAQFADSAPDAVITDVIMPDKDGYEVCQFIKEHERFGKTPVILMSGVVNRTVAEKAMQVKADELVRKPFQPQDLIARVKSLLNPAGASPAQRGSLREEEANSSQAASRVLSGLFSPPPAPQNNAPANFASSNFAPGNPATTSAWRTEPAETFAPRPSAPATRLAPPPAQPQRAAAAPPSADTQKLRHEIRRLELLVKKLQAELEAQKQYCAALEADFKSMQETE